jgi:hypothetical protein
MNSGFFFGYATLRFMLNVELPTAIRKSRGLPRRRWCQYGEEWVLVTYPSRTPATWRLATLLAPTQSGPRGHRSPPSHDQMITGTLLTGIFPFDCHAARHDSRAPESDLFRLTFRSPGPSSCSSS